MSPVLLAAAVTAVATWLFLSPGAAASRLRRLLPAAEPHGRRRNDPRVLTPLSAAAGIGVIAACLGLAAGGPAALVPVGLAAGEFARRLLEARRERAASALRAELAAWCTAIATELRIGRTTREALAASTGEASAALSAALAPALAVADLGGDIATGLSAAATTKGAEALRYVAACWTVAGDTGAGLATALQRIGNSLQTTEQMRSEVSAQLAAARASARLLAVLPVFGLLLGQAVGAHPLHFLLRTPAGAACLAATAVLNVAGLLWTDRIAARVPLS